MIARRRCSGNLRRSAESHSVVDWRYSRGGGHPHEAQPDAQVGCLFLDVFLADSARRRWSEVSNLQVDCEPDFVVDEVDVCASPLAAGGQSELARELMQSAISRLSDGGRLFVSTDNRKTTGYFGEQLERRFACR